MKEPWYIVLAPIWCCAIGVTIGIVIDGPTSPLVLVLGYVGLLLGAK